MANENTFGAQEEMDRGPDFVDKNNYSRIISEDVLFHNPEQELASAEWAKEYANNLSIARERKNMLEKKDSIAEAMRDARVTPLSGGNYSVLVNGEVHIVKGSPQHDVTGDDLRAATKTTPDGQYQINPGEVVDNSNSLDRIVIDYETPGAENLTSLKLHKTQIDGIGNQVEKEFEIHPGDVWKKKVAIGGQDILTIESITQKDGLFSIKFKEEESLRNLDQIAWSEFFSKYGRVIRIEKDDQRLGEVASDGAIEEKRARETPGETKILEPQEPSKKEFMEKGEDRAENIDSLELVELITNPDIRRGNWKYKTFNLKPNQVWKDKTKPDDNQNVLTIEYIKYNPHSMRYSLKFLEKKEPEVFKHEGGVSKFSQRHGIVQLFANLKQVGGPDAGLRFKAFGSVTNDSDDSKTKEPRTLWLDENGVITHKTQDIIIGSNEKTVTDNPDVVTTSDVTAVGSDLKDGPQKEDSDSITIDSVIDPPKVIEKTSDDIVEATEEKDPIKILVKNFKITGLTIGNPDQFDKQISALEVFSARLFDYSTERESEILTKAKKELEAVGVKIDINDRNINDSYIDKLYDLIRILREKHHAVQPVSHSVGVPVSTVDGSKGDVVEKNANGRSMVLEYEGTKIEIKVGNKYKINGTEIELTILDINIKDDNKIEIKFDNIENPAEMAMVDWVQMFSVNLTEVK